MTVTGAALPVHALADRTDPLGFRPGYDSKEGLWEGKATGWW